MLTFQREDGRSRQKGEAVRRRSRWFRGHGHIEQLNPPVGSHPDLPCGQRRGQRPVRLGLHQLIGKLDE